MSDSAGSEVFEQNDQTEVDQLRAEVANLKDSIGVLQSEIADMGAAIEGLFGLQGDENVAPTNGFIEVDHAVPKHPVIRFRADRLPSSGDTYVSGDDTKIVFTPDGGVIKVDVYYS